MGFDLAEVNKRLIVEASELFPKASFKIDSKGAAQGKGYLSVTYKNKEVRFPFFKNLAILQKDTLELDGLILFSQKINKVYLPRSALKAFF